MILVTGGTRSGKSEFAEMLVMAQGDRYLYLATAKVTDAEMARRVERHQARRSNRWTTHEGYNALWKVLEETQGQYDGILLDCVSTMVTNLLFDFIGDKDWDTFDFADVDYKEAERQIIPVFEKIAQAANLFAFLPMSLSALKLHSQNGLLKTKGILGVVIPAAVLSVPASLLATFLQGEVLGKLFGGFLIGLSVLTFQSVKE